MLIDFSILLVLIMNSSSEKRENGFNLKGHLLIAMPGMEDARFARTVILICSHSEDGSMGFILNQPVTSPTFSEILDELGLEKSTRIGNPDVPIFKGGPVEQGRGFVIHSLDYSSTTSARVDDLAAVTATLDILRKLASEEPPQDSIMLLGYAGWSEGQLEEEIAQNGWLTMPANRKLVFQTAHDEQYEAALAAMGISEELLSANAGHA